MNTLPRFHAFTLLMLSLCGVAAAATSVSQFEITWTFDRDCQVGQFATGDWWVMGPVTIVGIEPRSVLVGDRIMNGAMVNPSPWGSKRKQGYDNQMPVNAYDPALNVAFDVSPAKPLILPPHSSLVSTISIETRVQGNDTQLLRAAVLTVLPAAAPAGSFRPPYCGVDKSIRFNKAQLGYKLLRRLPPVAGTPSLASVEQMFVAPWLDHQPGWIARYQHPRLNMPEYGREMHRNIGIGALMLHLDYEPAQKEKLLIGYVQLGIDLYGVIAAGGRTNWMADGGHASGRKWPILFAGLMLNDPEMKAIGQKSGDYLYQNGYGPGKVPPDYIHFGEDDQTHYVTQADVDITTGPAWKPDARADVKTPYGPNDLNLPEWGIRHATAPEQNNAWLGANYRTVVGPTLHGTCLAALLTPGGRQLWNHDALFDYTDRYMRFTAPDGEYPGWWRSMNKFTEAMWDTYRTRREPVRLGGAKVELVPADPNGYLLRIEVPVDVEQN